VGLIKRLNSLAQLAVAMSGSKGAERPASVFAEQERLVRVASVAKAQSYLPFAVRVPQQLGLPVKVAASPERAVASGHAAIVFQYEETSTGAMTVMEQAGSMVVTVRGGNQAIVEVSETGAMARWIENGVVFTVIMATPSREDLLAVVERV
jgi:hypothetical protein